MPNSPVLTSSSGDPFYPLSFVDQKWLDVVAADNLKISYNSKYAGRYVYNVKAPAVAATMAIEPETLAPAPQKDKKKIVI